MASRDREALASAAARSARSFVPISAPLDVVMGLASHWLVVEACVLRSDGMDGVRHVAPSIGRRATYVVLCWDRRFA
jgi:hypothetical protein